MKIVIDENITYGQEAFSGFGELEIMLGRDITNDILKDADALIVRSITNVNEQLLEGTNVKFVGTATIGTDHIDKEYLKANNITFADAKGCNSDAVAEYVWNALFNIFNEKKTPLRNKTIGVVGVGNIGGRIVRYANALGMTVLKNDPPLERKGMHGFLPLEEVMKADIVTFHVPLNNGGVDNTVHLVNKDNIECFKDEAVIINASRGAVIDNQVFLDELRSRNLTAVIDVWENEPDVNKELLGKVKYGTPHVAGYSLEGKINGTIMMYNAYCEFLGKEPDWNVDVPIPVNSFIGVNGNSDIETELRKIFNHTYRISDDDKKMKEAAGKDGNAGWFDRLRKNYPLRRELVNYNAAINPANENMAAVFKTFRVKII